MAGQESYLREQFNSREEEPSQRLSPFIESDEAATWRPYGDQLVESINGNDHCLRPPYRLGDCESPHDGDGIIGDEVKAAMPLVIHSEDYAAYKKLMGWRTFGRF